jgi:Family of unknown function (DUF5343)
MATKDDKHSGPLPPYISFKTLTGFLQKLKDTTVPGQIDSSVLRSYAGSVARQLVLALKYLGLIQANGASTDRLKKLVASYNAPEWKDQLAEAISDAYLAVVENLDIDNGTPKQLQDAFRAAGADGVVMQRAIAFYLSALREAGLTFSPHFADKTRRPKSDKTRKTKTHAQDEPDKNGNDDVQAPSTPGIARFNFPIPGLTAATIIIPSEVSSDDWEMIHSMVTAYIARKAKGK